MDPNINKCVLMDPEIYICPSCSECYHIKWNKHKNNCNTHPNKQLDYYCKDCSKPICFDCVMLGDEKTCQLHCIISICDAIGIYLAKLGDITNHTPCSNFAIQRHRAGYIQEVLKMKITEIEFLKKAKIDDAGNLQRAKTTLNTIEFSQPDKLLEMDLSSLLEEADRFLKAPWCLNQLESGQSEEVIFNENTSITDYNQLKMQNSEHRLCSTKELIGANEEIPEPPTSTVYPSVKDDNSPVMEQVTPLLDTELPKELFEGSKEQVYVTHIVHPHDFYVQRASQLACVRNLVKELKNADSYARPSEKYIIEGKMYLAYNNEDSIWHRCRIFYMYKRDENTTIYHVFSIDFGCSFSVNIDNLRCIPQARMFSPPPFAINCSLADCEPIKDFWTRDDNILMRDILYIDNNNVMLHIKKIISMPTGKLRLCVCDVTTLRDGVSLAHALAFHNRARIPVDLPYPNVAPLCKNQLIFGNHNFKKKAIVDVVIMHVVNPDHFFVRELCLQSTYEKLCNNLEQEYNVCTKSAVIYLPEQYMACIANVQEYGLGTKWARGVVLQKIGIATVRVFLVDIGAIVLLHWCALRRIHVKYTVEPGYAIECYLAGVAPLSNKWDPESVTLLRRFQYIPMEMHVEDNRDRNSLGIALYYKFRDKQTICVNELMVKKEFAINFGLFMFNQITPKKPTLNQLSKFEVKGEITILKNKPTKAIVSKDEHLEAKDKGPLKLEAKILNYESPSLMYVSLVFQQKAFTKLSQNIQEYYSKNKTQGRTDWKVGDRCCTISNQSQTWRRAIILEIKNENAIVFFSDFACVETVSVLSLREITQELASKGDAAIKCHLHGVKSSSGEEWLPVTKLFLKEFLDMYNIYFITKIGKFKDKSMPIELWVPHTIQRASLKINYFRWHCLNNKIINQGLAIRDIQDTEKEKVTNDSGDEELRSLHINYEVEPMPLKYIKMADPSTPNKMGTSNEENPTLKRSL